MITNIGKKCMILIIDKQNITNCPSLVIIIEYNNQIYLNSTKS